MKTLVFALQILAMIFTLNLQAQASGPESFTTLLSITGKWSPVRAEKAQQLCYQIAAQGEFLRTERTESPWFSKDKERVWRVTQLSSGLVCKEMVVGGNDRQYGDVNLVGCVCEGPIEIVR